jgi:hypothetical protein
VQLHDPHPDPAACTFSAHPTPDRLRCDQCGEVLGAIDPCAEPAGDPPPLGLAAWQAARRWPDLAEAVREHAVVCPWRRNPPPPEGWYVHLQPREGAPPRGD